MAGSERRTALAAARSARHLRTTGVVALVVTSCAAVLLALPDEAGARFSAVTGSAPLSAAAARVSLVHDRSAVLLAPVVGAMPGDRDTVCLRATYTGSVAGQVQLRVDSLSSTGATASSAGLAPHLLVTVDVATGAATTDCTSSTGFVRLSTGRLTALPTAWSASPPAGTWNPAAAGEERTYRISYRLVGDRAGEDSRCTVVLALEARNA